VDKAEIVKDQIIRELITFFIWLFKILPKARLWRISRNEDIRLWLPKQMKLSWILFSCRVAPLARPINCKTWQWHIAPGFSELHRHFLPRYLLFFQRHAPKVLTEGTPAEPSEPLADFEKDIPHSRERRLFFLLE
jgi:hypothetical protein